MPSTSRTTASRSVDMGVKHPNRQRNNEGPKCPHNHASLQPATDKPPDPHRGKP